MNEKVAKQVERLSEHKIRGEKVLQQLPLLLQKYTRRKLGFDIFRQNMITRAT